MSDRHLVLVGAGHAHVEVLRRLARAPVPDARVTLVTRADRTGYSGMLPGVLLGRYRPEQMLIPVAPLAARAGARLVVAEADGLDPGARRLRLTSGGAIAYDILSLDVGSAPRLGPGGTAPGWIAARPIDSFLDRFAAAEAGLPRHGARLAVIGAGAAGTEVALALAHRYRGRGARIELRERGDDILPALPAAARRAVRHAAAASGVEVVTKAGAVPGDADLALWTTGAAAPDWVAGPGLAVDGGGFVLVGPCLRSLSHDSVFAAGDVAAMAGTPRPKAGVFAVRQGPVLAENLRRCLGGRPLRAFRPQRDWLTLLALGPGRALATRNGLVAAGGWVWLWKDAIDLRFVARYRG